MPRPRGNRKEARLSVSLDGKEYAALCELARQRDVSAAWLARQAIHTLLEQEQDKARNPELPLLRRASSQSEAGR